MRLALLASLALWCSCTPRIVDHPSLAKDRTPGTTCFAGDSASAKRDLSHPLGPAGGWGTGVSVDHGREPKASELGLNRAGIGRIAGFLRVTEDGYLRARSYDDSYGEVYCGWSPERLEVKGGGVARVSLPTCAMGDGGLKQVHEVCWFPAGSERGKIVYSSEHPGAKQNAAELYRKEDLGSKQYFNERLAFEVIEAARALGDRKMANEVIADSLLLIDQQQDRVEFPGGKKIPAREVFAEVRKRLEALRD
jgi:hypothetical protein